ncbi:bifunctional riboflavin kinase/FAD synthetase [Croceibacter atlanticus]|uniref:Riboflavin biosynthesis protein n=1 Tax=Croceibacter atlanticus (strain ATCC BAA-628 / JCM 21780 / CIP 108009 / IAM 15332 / KCTC 12090 / HTCC2559) TaxID=216432 RepID=A3U6M8_CROAH|nr:bifunctional riboflavin kinase/FAD synthetase [Croceibacter atlanticus]EAP87895.1 Riboflavin kinase / FAD synthetase [Croceibacter atlanticus HTCC2559]MBW4969883.1 bifunctional riboflavin kinase/FAD synthetase [Croceibacter atlanticus]
MEQHTNANTFSGSKNTVVTIGTFDGVHIGHQKIVNRLVNQAELDSVILTFFPHPRMVLQQDNTIKLLHTIEEKTTVLEQLGLDHLVIHPFTKEFSRLTAQQFVENILVNQLKAKKIIIGYDHRFGRNRTADISTFKDFGEQYGFVVEEITKQDVDDVAVSSTKIRTALQKGQIEKANAFLGQPYMLTGTIVKGKGIGKTLGYPTANIQIEEAYKLIPKNGVYIVKTNFKGITYFGMMNIGTNPTVGGKSQTIETYFFNMDTDLYGSKMTIQMLKRIRDEKKFASVDQLIEAMQNDEKISINYIETLS